MPGSKETVIDEVNLESPDVGNVSPNVENVSPNVENVSPNVDNVSPNVENVSPNVENVSPILKTIEEFNKSVEIDVDDQVQILSLQIISTFKNREINASNWMNLVTHVIQCVEGVAGLNGGEKKELAIEIVLKSIDGLKLPDNQIVRSLLSRDSLDNTIDLLISASKGQIDLNKIKKFAVNCILGCIKNNSTYEPEISINNLNSNIDFYQELIEDFKQKDINMSNWMSIVTRVMQDVEKLKNLNGPEKKDLAIQITIKIFNKLNIEDPTLKPLFTHSTLSSVIDTLISVSKNKVKLNNKVDARKKPKKK
jgi:hypothetical protein